MRATTHPEPLPDQFPGAFEPVYPVSGSTELLFPSEYHELLADFFCHCIARDPNDLRSHVRRILLEHEREDRGQLFAALLDLFIALGKRGIRLRGRMLEFAKDKLDPSQYGLLSESFAKGLDSFRVPVVFGSMLGRGIEGNLNLARPVTDKREATRDALVEAREYLEYSQLDEARTVLERAILREPRRAELYLDLLAIYRSTRDRGNFSRMSRELERMEAPLPEAWRELAEYFRSLND